MTGSKRDARVPRNFRVGLPGVGSAQILEIEHAGPTSARAAHRTVGALRPGLIVFASRISGTRCVFVVVAREFSGEGPRKKARLCETKVPRIEPTSRERLAINNRIPCSNLRPFCSELTPRVVRANGGHGIHGENGAIEKRERAAGIAVSAVRARRPCIRTPFPVTGTALFVVGPPKAPVLRRTPKVRQSQPCTRRRCLGVSAVREGAGVPDAGARTGVCRACELGRRWVGW